MYTLVIHNPYVEGETPKVVQYDDLEEAVRVFTSCPWAYLYDEDWEEVDVWPDLE